MTFIYYKDGKLNKYRTFKSLAHYYTKYWLQGKRAPKLIFNTSLRDLRLF